MTGTDEETLIWRMGGIVQLGLPLLAGRDRIDVSPFFNLAVFLLTLQPPLAHSSNASAQPNHGRSSWREDSP